jgi:DNA-binding transcriptional regulator YdaS (Cro superfamily)
MRTTDLGRPAALEQTILGKKNVSPGDALNIKSAIKQNRSPI